MTALPVFQCTGAIDQFAFPASETGKQDDLALGLRQLRSCWMTA